MRLLIFFFDAESRLRSAQVYSNNLSYFDIASLDRPAFLRYQWKHGKYLPACIENLTMPADGQAYTID